MRIVNSKQPGREVGHRWVIGDCWAEWEPRSPGHLEFSEGHCMADILCCHLCLPAPQGASAGTDLSQSTQVKSTWRRNKGGDDELTCMINVHDQKATPFPGVKEKARVQKRRISRIYKQWVEFLPLVILVLKMDPSIVLIREGKGQSSWPSASYTHYRAQTERSNGKFIHLGLSASDIPLRFPLGPQFSINISLQWLHLPIKNSKTYWHEVEKNNWYLLIVLISYFPFSSLPASLMQLSSLSPLI